MRLGTIVVACVALVGCGSPRPEPVVARAFDAPPPRIERSPGPFVEELPDHPDFFQPPAPRPPPAAPLTSITLVEDPTAVDGPRRDATSGGEADTPSSSVSPRPQRWRTIGPSPIRSSGYGVHLGRATRPRSSFSLVSPSPSPSPSRSTPASPRAGGSGRGASGGRGLR